MGFRSKNLLAGILFCVLEIVLITRSIVNRQPVDDNWLVIVGMVWATVIIAAAAFRASAKRDRLKLGVVCFTLVLNLARHLLDPAGVQIARFVGLAFWVFLASAMGWLYFRDRLTNHKSPITN